jgi:hypothetical protein
MPFAGYSKGRGEEARDDLDRTVRTFAIKTMFDNGMPHDWAKRRVEQHRDEFLAAIKQAIRTTASAVAARERGEG